MNEEKTTPLHCDHGNDKSCAFLGFMPLGEVYMCECGALVDVSNEGNYRDPFAPMSPAELEAQFKAHAQAVVRIIVKNIEEDTR